MNEMDLPVIGHIGYMVEDIEQSAKWYQALFSIEGFYIYDFTPMRAWVNEEEIFDCRMKIGMGTLNDGKKIELIQPISGESTPHMMFLKSKGSNIHHFALHVKEYDKWRTHCKENLKAKIIFEAEAEDDVIGYRRSFYSYIGDAAGVVEISEIPWKR